MENRPMFYPKILRMLGHQFALPLERAHQHCGQAAMLLFAVYFCLGVAHAYDIKNCSDDAKANLSTAADFIEANMSAIVDQYTFLTEKQRQEIVRKWPKITLRCKDGSGSCRKDSDRYGYSHGGPGNAISMCHGNMVDMGYSTCDGVEAIMHETGHMHGFRMVPGHNDPTAYHFDHDPIYRMGTMAQAFCEADAAAGGVSDKAFIGTKRTALGDSCSKNTDCASGNCEDKQCVCNDDTDCPGQRCFTPLTEKNYCESTDLPLGTSCKKDSQCASDKCTKDVCVCASDEACGGGFCDPGNAKAAVNGCAAKLVDDEYCTASHQCKSGICRELPNKSTAAFCITENAKNAGEDCHFDVECRLGKCNSKGSCVCNKDDDCGSGWCDQGIDAHENSCKEKLESGAACGKFGEFGLDRRCKSGNCKSFSYRCE
jgi:hypothetical protein